MYTCYVQSFKILASFCSWAGWFEFTQSKIPEDTFSHEVAQINKTWGCLTCNFQLGNLLTKWRISVNSISTRRDIPFPPASLIRCILLHPICHPGMRCVRHVYFRQVQYIWTTSWYVTIIWWGCVEVLDKMIWRNNFIYSLANYAIFLISGEK